MDDFDFGSLEIIEIPVVGPNKKKYKLREASGDAVARFNNERTRCMKFQDGGVSGVSGQGQLEMFLVASCLFNVDEDEEPIPTKPITMNELRPWPGKVVTRLFNKAKEISEIDLDVDLVSLRKQYKELGERIAKMEEDEAKNEPSSTETGLS